MNFSMQFKGKAPSCKCVLNLWTWDTMFCIMKTLLIVLICLVLISKVKSHMWEKILQSFLLNLPFLIIHTTRKTHIRVHKHALLWNEKWKMAFPSPQDETVTFHLDHNPTGDQSLHVLWYQLSQDWSPKTTHNNHLLLVRLTFTKWLSFP